MSKILNLFLNLFKHSFYYWVNTASYEELAEGYENRRKESMKKDGRRTSEMEIINNEMVRRSNEKYKKEHPNAKPVHRSGGWYLPSDDDDYN